MKNILIFNDISGLGNCSAVANIAIFNKLGHYCMPIITGNYSCQTGFDGYLHYGNAHLADYTDSLLRHRQPQAVYVGFCNDAATLFSVTQIASALAHKGAYLLVDPVMGDNGKLYPVFDDEYIKRMRAITRSAHCITPNFTEACLLADVDYDAIMQSADKPGFLAKCGAALKNLLKASGADSAVVTGVECGDLIGNIVMDGKSVHYVTNSRVDITYSGTGDVFSSVLLGELLNGVSLLAATQIAANFVEKAARNTQCTDRRFGVEFGRVMDIL